MEYKLKISHQGQLRCIKDALNFAIVIRKFEISYIAPTCYNQARMSRDSRDAIYKMLIPVEVKFKRIVFESIPDSFIKYLEILRKLHNTLELGENILTEAEVSALRDECEILARVYMAQLDVIPNIFITYFENSEDYLEFRQQVMEVKVLIDDLPKNAHYSITSPEYPEDGRTLFDINQVLRHRLAWDRNPKGGIFVQYDEPHQYGKVPLVEISHA